MKKKGIALLTTLCMLVGLLPAGTAMAADTETKIVLADSGVTVNGAAASTANSSAVYVGEDIIYYEDGKDSSYGAGTAADAHTAEEAKNNTVVTITKAGIYRISGQLSAGQIAVDLGSDAASDPNAVVTLILDGVDITCKVAPAVIFYNVWESGDASVATTDIPDLAGANVILADGSVNTVNGSYVAKIYKEGTTSKKYKFDGAFYSKMSMIVDGESAGTGVLNVNGENEGLDSELHLTINGGAINIIAQNDGINTNEDGISVTEINGGTLYVNAGLGAEGDGVDSNGSIVINGGTVISMANGQTGDGGLDADGEILLNGGTVVATGSRNDATSSNSAQPYMELSYSTTKAANTIIHIEDANGNTLLNYAPGKLYQSFTFSSAELKLNTVYHVYAGGSVSGGTQTYGLYTGGTYTGGTQQQYTGNTFGVMGGGMGGQRPDNGTGTKPERPADGMEQGMPMQRPEGTFNEGDMHAIPEGGFMPDFMNGAENTATAEGSVDFVLTATTHSFSGVSEAVASSGKTKVTFQINSSNKMVDVAAGTALKLENITMTDSVGNAVSVPQSQVQLTISDDPSENYLKTCLLSDGAEGIAAILPDEVGTYVLTIAVDGENETYTGSAQYRFEIHEAGWVAPWPFTDVAESDADNWFYSAVKYAYENGMMSGVTDNTFAPDSETSRAMIVTILWRAAGAPTASGSAAFADVSNGSWYSAAVAWAVENGIVTGYDSTAFGPNDHITREQLAAILSRYAVYGGSAADGSADALNGYADRSSVSSYAVQPMGWAVTNGIITGQSNSLLVPQGTATRAEAATMLMRMIK